MPEKSCGNKISAAHSYSIDARELRSALRNAGALSPTKQDLFCDGGQSIQNCSQLQQTYLCCSDGLDADEPEEPQAGTQPPPPSPAMLAAIAGADKYPPPEEEADGSQQEGSPMFRSLSASTMRLLNIIKSLAAFNITTDGRLKMSYREEALDEIAEEASRQDSEMQQDLCMDAGWEPPCLTVVILIVGTRGDVQPFIALGRAMAEYGHRVRLATHALYRDWVTSHGLEFYPLGGDPKVLSEYIARNRGIVPHGGLKDIKMQRTQLADIINSTYAACTEPDPEGDGRAFRAESIIANPPSLGHIHCAEKLGVPLHIFFTMPWSPTTAFAHPLAIIANGPTIQRHLGKLNKMSYYTTDSIVWAGHADIVNKFRKEIGLKPLWMFQGANLLNMHKIPHTYCWSPALVPKPQDWKDHIDVVGFFFLNESRHLSYTPPEDLRQFLQAGPPPVYVGVGSLVVDNPRRFTKTVYEAAHKTGTRVILSRGWVNLGEGFKTPSDVFLLGDCPHDWLFPQCSAVVHHGGAGTTAAGLYAGCPTTIVPFFGDQPFWGEACRRAGVGPAPIPIDSLTTKKLVAALNFMKRPEVVKTAKLVAQNMQKDNGVRCGLESFHKQLLRHRDYVMNRDTMRVEWPASQPSQLRAVQRKLAQHLKSDIHFIGSTYQSANSALTQALTFAGGGFLSVASKVCTLTFCSCLCCNRMRDKVAPGKDEVKKIEVNTSAEPQYRNIPQQE